MRLGLIGLGNIGSGIGANLVADGHQLSVFDIDPAAVQRLEAAGAQAASSPEAVAVASQWTFLSLPSPAVMEAVAAEWQQGARDSGKILIDLTTNAPSVVRGVGARLAATGSRLVEAPVTGGAPGARNRKLVFITGGDHDAVDAVTPLLLTLGRGSFHMGPLGSGNVGKLVNSLMAFTSMWVSLEGLGLAAKYGLDLRTLVDMVKTSGGASPYLDRRVEEINERGRPAEFSLELAAKDAGLMLDAGRDVGVPMPVASAVHQMLTFAKAQGLADHDISDLVEVMERLADVQLRLGPAPTA